MLGAALCAFAACGRGAVPMITYFSNAHALSMQYPAGWRSQQQEKDGVWFRTFTPAADDAGAGAASVSATLLVAPPTSDLDAYARTFGAGGMGLDARGDERPGLRGRSYRFETAGGTRHLLLLAASAGDGPAPGIFGFHAQGLSAAFDTHRTTLEAMAASVTLERAVLYPEVKNAAFAFALRVPPSWRSQRTLSRGDSYLGQWQSPAIAADAKGNTGHASLTLAVQPGPGDGSLEAYYNSVRASLGDSFPVLSHTAWNGGWADLMRTETQVSESRIKRYYRVAAGKGYSLTCEAEEEQWSRMDRWCDIIASSLRVGAEVGS